jgi:hypothetical protein
MLHRLYAVFQDYHQALGYVCSFLSLTIDEETVMKVCLSHPCHWAIINCSPRSGRGPVWLAARPPITARPPLHRCCSGLAVTRSSCPGIGRRSRRRTRATRWSTSGCWSRATRSSPSTSARPASFPRLMSASGMCPLPRLIARQVDAFPGPCYWSQHNVCTCVCVRRMQVHWLLHPRAAVPVAL